MGQEYVFDDEVATFFSKTTVTRESCDALARELVSGDRVVPVEIQGSCSYTVYAGTDFDHVVQFRLESLALKVDTAILVRQMYGAMAPGVSFKQRMREDGP